VIRFLRTWLAIPTESPQTGDTVVREAGEVLHVVCCRKAEYGLCGAPITNLVRADADCVVCADLSPELHDDWCIVIQDHCPLTEEP
jgi:hypothetical protein